MMQEWLPRKLRLLRAEQGLTLVEAAEQAGIGRDTLSDLERGRRHPVTPTLAKIAKGYGVPVEELLEEPVPLALAPPASPPPDTAAEAGRNGGTGLLANPAIGEWLRERGLLLGTMTDAEFREHVHGLDLVGRDEDGRPVSVMELMRDLVDERAEARDLLWNQSNYGSLGRLLDVDPDTSVAAQKRQRRDQLNELRKELNRRYGRRAHAVERYAELLARLWDQALRETAA
jgi:transcriptional regulator with XRE-family HTH domain